jgi:hypothetical protein
VPGKWACSSGRQKISAQILNWGIPLVNAHHDAFPVLFDEKRELPQMKCSLEKLCGIELRHTGVLHTQLHDYVAGGAPFLG